MVHFKTAVITLLSLLICCCKVSAMEELWLDEFETIAPITIANLKQKPQDVSASITVINRDDIERRRFRDIYDLLRSVPGMTVIRNSSPVHKVDYAGGGIYLGRGLEVQVNGVSQTMPIHSTTIFDFLVPLENIERVEVVRGSNAATDGGSKSFKGTINIITLKPELQHPSFTEIKGDSYDQQSVFSYFNYASNSHHHFSLSGRYNTETGYDYYKSLNSSSSPAENIDDDATMKNVHFQYYNDLSNATSLRANGSMMSGDFLIRGMHFLVDEDPDPADSDMDYGQMTVDFKHRTHDWNELNVITSYQDWKWKQHWNACGPKSVLSPEFKEFANQFTELVPDLLTGNFNAIADYLPEIIQYPGMPDLLNELISPGSLDPVCGYWPLSANINRTTVSVKNNSQLADSLRLATGFHATRSTLSGELFNRKKQYDSYRASAHAQWQLSNAIINLGVADEKYNGQDAVSTRGGVNYHIGEKTTLRVVASRSEKHPDVADLDNDLGKLFLVLPEAVYGSTEHLIYDGSQLAKNTRPQLVYNKELGINLHPSRHQNIDLRFFEDKYRNASFYDIYLVIVPPSGSMDKRGFEAQYNAKAGKYHYGLTLHDHNSEASQSEEDYKSTGGSFYLNTHLQNDIYVGFNLYYWKRTSDNDGDMNHKIVEFQMGKRIFNDLEINASLRHQNTPYSTRIFYPSTYFGHQDQLNSINVDLKLFY